MVRHDCDTADMTNKEGLVLLVLLLSASTSQHSSPLLHAHLHFCGLHVQLVDQQLASHLCVSGAFVVHLDDHVQLQESGPHFHECDMHGFYVRGSLQMLKNSEDFEEISLRTFSHSNRTGSDHCPEF